MSLEFDEEEDLGENGARKRKSASQIPHLIVSKKVGSRKDFERLKKLTESFLEYLDRTDPMRIIEDSYDIRKEIDPEEGEEEDIENYHYELGLAVGGPAVYVRTDGYLEGEWWSNSIKIRITDKNLLDKLSVMEGILDSLERAGALGGTD